jgi:chaperonin GroES
MNIRPLHDRVIVKRMEEERTSPGGIVLPDGATEKPVKGEVVAVGNGKVLDSGEMRALDVKAGDQVLFGKYSGTEIKVYGEELLVMKEDDIVAIFEG